MACMRPTSIDDKPKRVVFGAQATTPGAYLETVEHVDFSHDEEVDGAGSPTGKSFGSDASTAFAPSDRGETSFGTSSIGGSWGPIPETLKTTLNEPEVTNAALAKDPFGKEMDPEYGCQVTNLLIAQQQQQWAAGFPGMFPPGIPPPFPWWDMYCPGPSMPGPEKEYLAQMAQSFRQLSQQDAFVAKTYRGAPQQGGRQQQKGKAQAVPKQPPAAKPKVPQDPDPPRDQDREDDPSYRTVMLKNVPANYTPELLVRTLNEAGYHKLYDFVYLPVEFKKKMVLGYAFVNLINHETAHNFKQTMRGYESWLKDTQGNRLELNGDTVKAAEVRWGKLHDKNLHIQRYRSSDLMHPSVPDEYKPMLFGADGEQEVFPGPELGKRMQPPRAVKADQLGARKKESAVQAASGSQTA